MRISALRPATICERTRSLTTIAPVTAITGSRVRKLAAVAGMTVAILGCSTAAASADPWGAESSPSSYGNAGWGKACYDLHYQPGYE